MIATNGFMTYVLYLYEDINWGDGDTSIGFNAGDGTRAFNLPEAANTQSILNLESTSNVGIPGAYYFRVDQDSVILPTEEGTHCQIYDAVNSEVYVAT